MYVAAGGGGGRVGDGTGFGEEKTPKTTNKQTKNQSLRMEKSGGLHCSDWM